MRERACNSKKAGKVEEADEEHPGPSLPSVLNNIPSVPKDDAMSGSVMLINGDETSGQDTVCDGVTRSPPDPKKQSSVVTEDVKSVQNHEGPSAQPENTNSCDALSMDNDMPTEVYDVARKQDGGKGHRLKLKKSKYFENSTKDTGSTDSRVLSREDEASVKKILDEGREESQMEEGIVMATKMAENSEELMDMMEDEVSPVFGQCSIGSSSSSSSRKAQSGSSTKKTDADGKTTFHTWFCNCYEIMTYPLYRALSIWSVLLFIFLPDLAQFFHFTFSRPSFKTALLLIITRLHPWHQLHSH